MRQDAQCRKNGWYWGVGALCTAGLCSVLLAGCALGDLVGAPYLHPSLMRQLAGPDLSENPPVLCVPGLLDTHRKCRFLIRSLSARGLRVIRAVDLHPNDASAGLAHNAQQVAEAVAALRQDTGAKRIDIVAFSMGTLVVRDYLERGGGKAVVRKFVSISGPHHGTLTGYLGWNRGEKEMRPGSAYLRALEETDGFGDVEIYTFGTPFDLMIFPFRSGDLSDAKRNQHFWVPLHPFMMLDADVLLAVANVLTNPPPNPS